jgi:S1-C subfamily serine protease
MSDEPSDVPEDEGATNDGPAPDDAPIDETQPSAKAAHEAPPPGPPPKRTGFYVPTWLAAVAAAAVVLGLFWAGFGVGRVTASGDDQDRTERLFERPFPGRGPGEGRARPGEGRERPASRVFLGVSTREATGDQQGAEIVNVANDSPAAQAGLQAGDVITAVDGDAVTSPVALARQIRGHDPGDQVTITYTRDGNSAQAQAQLANRSEERTSS